MSNEQRNERNANTTNPNTTGAQGMASEPVISVRDLTVSFASEAGTVHAVRGMNFDLYPGKTLGIVGESGSGKSVTSMAIMGLLDKNASVKGSITYHGEELLNKSDFEELVKLFVYGTYFLFFRCMVPCVPGMRRRVGRGPVSSWW